MNQRKKWEREEIERAITLHALAIQIAEHLPDYRIVDEGSQGLRSEATLAGPGDLSIDLRINNGRLRVTGNYLGPVIFDGRNVAGPFFPRGEEVPVITCDPARPPHKIAADIKRRFLPKYQEAYAVQAEERRQCVDRLNSERAALIAVASATGRPVEDSNKIYFSYGSPHSPHGKITARGFYNGDPAVINFEIDGVPLETALWIAAELADCKRRAAGGEA